MDFLTAVYGAIKAIPIIDSWFKSLFKFYLERQIAEHKNDFAEAIVAVIKDKNQAVLERAMGSNNAGKPAVDRTDVEEIPAGEFEV